MIKISGHSDDVMMIEGNGLSDDLSEGTRLTIGNHEEGEGGVVVTLRYAADKRDGGVWSAIVSPCDEDIPVPWSIRLSAEGYTIIVEIDCPKGTPIKADVEGEERWLVAPAGV